MKAHGRFSDHCILWIGSFNLEPELSVPLVVNNFAFSTPGMSTTVKVGYKSTSSGRSEIKTSVIGHSSRSLTHIVVP